MRTLTALLLLFAANLAFADGAKLTVPKNALWQKECSSCHIAYPPQLLTADNWQTMMGQLDKHFGSNAELNAADKHAITEFLKSQAGKSTKFNARTLRISDTLWFKREHDEISSRVWSAPAVKSPANCTACHITAVRGDWSERGIKMPAGYREHEEYEHDHDDD